MSTCGIPENISMEDIVFMKEAGIAVNDHATSGKVCACQLASFTQ
ncbi:hypothetical protein [Ktedonobacter robiniae]|nr:hypothetical protein [Ktedonobacter robiniae]